MRLTLVVALVFVTVCLAFGQWWDHLVDAKKYIGPLMQMSPYGADPLVIETET